jgi:PPM family protein phosphatase
MRVVASGHSDVGLQREHNEDTFAVMPEFNLVIVADGMGGHRAGDVASRLATESMGEFFKKTAMEDATWPFHFDASMSEEENRLITAIRVANRQIYEHGVRSRDLRGMGTTVVGALYSVKKGKMYIGHVGDSRCYRVRGGQIELLTRDHSLFNDYLAAMPDMSEEQRSELPKNVITRALGMQDSVEVDIMGVECSEGDFYVLCSDGLSGMLADEEILQVVTEHHDVDQACRRLVTMANEHGGEDNVTVVVVRVDADEVVQEIGLGDTQPLVPAKPSRGPAPGSSGKAAPSSWPEDDETEADTPRAGPAEVRDDPPPSSP